MSTTHSHSIKEGNDGITYVVLEGDSDEYDAESFVKDAEATFKKDRHKIHDVIVDMSMSGESTFEGLRIYQDFLKYKQLGKIAFIMQDNEVVKMMVKIATINKKKDVTFVKTEEEAKRWLKKE